MRQHHQHRRGIVDIAGNAANPAVESLARILMAGFLPGAIVAGAVNETFTTTLRAGIACFAIAAEASDTLDA